MRHFVPALETIPEQPTHLRSRFSARSFAPGWLPAHVPELDGLRGLAVLGIFFFHARGRLGATWLAEPAAQGWAGVSLFFVLSGYLITSILLRMQSQPCHYFRNFYARRILRVWPIYYLLLAVCFFGPAWLLQLPAGISHTQALIFLVVFLQSLTSAPIVDAGALGPSWSLAIEEQYYLLWAPIVRWVRSRAALAVGLALILVASPLLRLHYAGALRPTHTLLHLDCIVLGSLLALALASLSLSRRTWCGLGCALAAAGFASAAAFARASICTDSALAFGFTGAVLAALAASMSRSLYARLLRSRLLRFYGRISYGFYMTHMAVFISLGLVYRAVDRSRFAGSLTADLSIVALQFALCTLVAAVLWYGFETKILRLKRYF